MEQQPAGKRDDTTANPFGVSLDGPLQRGTHACAINPKVAESTDLGMFGTRHPGGGG
ncbi:hypothetical protein P3W24_13435 [Luteibacter sp. PPL201]|jgi:hypothetical protein|uniref:Uncharacterized protein n=1 Tax=Luteibacter sahnii TaxID=3021977 RepID=A0ABT6BD75_9GAMM|nr:hypothetical protein [Luteibacter sp. PPL193]MDY1549868.1 hypothetical protein [Luteibacter sp. PPL193]